MKREWHHSAGVILFRQEESRSYLLVRSALTRRPAWEFPKGGLEPGESEVQAACREVHEETGLEPGDYSLLEGFRAQERYRFTRGAGEELRLIQKRVDYFLGQWHRGEIRLSREATRHHWVSYEAALRMLRFPEKRRILRAAELWLSRAPIPAS